MLIYSKKVDEKMKLFGTLNNVPSDEDELLIYTDGEGKEVEPALSLSQSFVDGGNHSIKRVEDGKEIKVFIGDVNVIPGEDSPVPPTPPVEGPWVTFSSDEPFTLNTDNNIKNWGGILEYSTDTKTWNEWDGTSIESINNKIYLRGSNNTVITGASNKRWVLTGANIACTGNIENLLDYQTVLEGNHPTMGQRCYCYMFEGCTSLTTAPELPATTLADYCYSGMFINCTSLITAPQLPATTLTICCYSNMFAGCTSLTTPPALPATTLAEQCYGSMFVNCTSLITAPELPATTLTNYCYRTMFSNCTSLTTPPELPATTLATECCRSMFLGCTSLVTAPTLPATTLAVNCYQTMFSSCTSLTSAPTLPATTLASGCYGSMFEGCSSLTAIPALPATTLADYCYNAMFKKCTSLVTIPILSATVLTQRCYANMFDSCTALKLSETYGGEYLTAVRIPWTGSGTIGTSSLDDMFKGTGGTFTGTPTINKTYYYNHPRV